MVVLALDIGMRRTGVAVNPTGGRLIIELPTLEYMGTELIAAVARLTKEYGASQIILGVVTDEREDMRSVVTMLKEQLDIPVYELSEALTTKEAERQLASEGRQGDSDARAARLILEQYLEEQR